MHAKPLEEHLLVDWIVEPFTPLTKLSERVRQLMVLLPLIGEPGFIGIFDFDEHRVQERAIAADPKEVGRPLTKPSEGRLRDERGRKRAVSATQSPECGM